MKQKSVPGKAPAEQVLKDIRRQTRRQYSAEEKIRIVLEGLRGEENISELCRREGIECSFVYIAHSEVAYAWGFEPGLVDRLLVDLESAPIEPKLRPLLRFVRKLV